MIGNPQTAVRSNVRKAAPATTLLPQKLPIEERKVYSAEEVDHLKYVHHTGFFYITSRVELDFMFPAHLREVILLF